MWEGGREQGHLLGVVVVVVLDVDSCCDPTDDEGDPAGDQVEPAGREVSLHTWSPRESTGWACPEERFPPSPWRCPRGARAGVGGVPYRSMGLGAAWDVSLSGCCGAFQVTSL